MSITTPAARYAIESDSEDEVPSFPNSKISTSSSSSPPISFKYVGNKVADRKPLVVATGEAAKAWARGAGLGEQVGGISEEEDGEQVCVYCLNGRQRILIIFRML